MSQWDHWDAKSPLHENSYHPWCEACQKYLVIPTVDRFMKYAQTCEHYERDPNSVYHPSDAIDKRSTI